MTRKILIATTIPETIGDFLLPFICYFQNLGWQVDGMALNITNNSVCVAEFDDVWDVQWSRNPLDFSNLVVAVPRIQEIIVQGNYDLVHVHTPVAAFVTRYAIGKLKIKQKPEVIYTVHGFHFHQQGNFFSNLIFLTLEKLAGSWTDYLITINREDETAAKKYRLLDADRICYTPGIGLDLNEYDPNQVSESEIKAIRQELGLNREDVIFLSIAEFTPNKRHQDQLLALKKLNRPEVHLAFAGDGQIRLKIEKLSATLGLQRQVHFLGFRQDIPVLICASVAMLLTSQREGLPRSIMEAFCAATPVIGTRIRGIQDLLADDCGFLVEVGDTEAIAQVMAKMIDDPQQTAQMGQNGRQKIDNYSVDRIIQLYVNIYNQALLNHE
jgi:glycosyltransferase involved in cell wall biosynthesis